MKHCEALQRITKNESQERLKERLWISGRITISSFSLKESSKDPLSRQSVLEHPRLKDTNRQFRGKLDQSTPIRCWGLQGTSGWEPRKRKDAQESHKDLPPTSQRVEKQKRSNQQERERERISKNCKESSRASLHLESRKKMLENPQHHRAGRGRGVEEMNKTRITQLKKNPETESIQNSKLEDQRQVGNGRDLLRIAKNLKELGR